MKRPGGDWSIRRFSVAQAYRLGRARLASVTDQSDHRPDPKPNLARYSPNTETSGAQLQRSFHLGPVALFDSAASKLLTLCTSVTRTSKDETSDSAWTAV